MPTREWKRRNLVKSDARVIKAHPETNRAKFKCQNCEHVWWGVILKKDPLGHIGSVESRAFMVHYWHDRVTVYCPNCSDRRLKREGRTR
jgi:predicted RNA-binding Zn-ribbon protein involved in translation (DUF1610 family)